MLPISRSSGQRGQQHSVLVLQTAPARTHWLPGMLQLPAVRCGLSSRARMQTPSSRNPHTHFWVSSAPSHPAWVRGIALPCPDGRAHPSHTNSPAASSSHVPGLSIKFTPLGSQVTSFLLTLSLLIFYFSLFFFFLTMSVQFHSR